MAPGNQDQKVDPPKISLASLEGMACVKVGPHHKAFYVHKSLLIHHSDYFRNALEGPWKEAQEGRVVLEDIEPNTFALFVHWLYHQVMPQDIRLWDALLPNPVPFTFQHNVFDLVKAYVFRDRFAAPAFRRVVNDLFADNYYFLDCNDFGRSVICYASEQISSHSILIQKLIDWYAAAVDGTDEISDQDALDELPRYFLRRVLLRCRELDIEYDFRDELYSNRCYREHIDNEEQQGCNKLHMTYDQNRDLARFE